MLQLILNKFLSMDPNLGKYLRLLDGKNLAIICTDYPKQSIYCNFTQEKIFLSSNLPAHIDVEISATLRSYLLFAISKQPESIKISGDALLAQIVQKLYFEMNIDWEEELAKITGDALAYETMQALRALKANSSHTVNSLADMLGEYLQEEAKILPTRYEVDFFMQQVDELRLRVDRLEARIKTYARN